MSKGFYAWVFIACLSCLFGILYHRMGFPFGQLIAGLIGIYATMNALVSNGDSRY